MKNLTTNNNKNIRTQDGKQVEIHEKGSLGLLALGFQGLMAWRLSRKELLVNSEVKTTTHDGTKK